jgi:hypothetical protein
VQSSAEVGLSAAHRRRNLGPGRVVEWEERGQRSKSQHWFLELEEVSPRRG